MNVRLIPVALVALLCFNGIAQADILASGPTFGGIATFGGGNVTCRIFNYGLTPVSITARQIFINTGTAVTPTSDTCNVALGSTKYCAFGAPITGNFAYSCRILVTGTDTRVSGVAELTDTGNAIVNAMPMQK
jgi:hypothetical protein